MLEFTQCWLFVLLGALAVAGAVVRVLSFVYCLLANRFFKTSLAQRYGSGSYVLVTGATDGLGKAFAFEVARRGFNVLLVSRNPAKLEAVKRELIMAVTGVKVETFAIDFSRLFTDSKAADLAAFAKNFDISIVINNVGVAYDRPVFFKDIAAKNPQEMTDLISTNIASQTLVHLYLGKQLGGRKRRAAFLDVSSVAVECIHPSNDIYGASKAYNRYLTNSLANTGDFPNVDYLSFQPGIMTTKMIASTRVTPQVRNSPMVVSAEAAASSCLDSLGLVRNTHGPLGFVATFLGQQAMNWAEGAPGFRLIWDQVIGTTLGSE